MSKKKYTFSVFPIGHPDLSLFPNIIGQKIIERLSNRKKTKPYIHTFSYLIQISEKQNSL